MRKQSIFLAVLFVLLFASWSWAETAIKAEVDRVSLTTDDTLTYKIVVTSSENKLPAPNIPKFEGFSIISQADSSTISFVKGEIKTILVYAFILAPTVPGKFSVGPTKIKVKDKVYTSDSFEVEVTQGKAAPVPLPQEEPILPGEPKLEGPQTIL